MYWNYENLNYEPMCRRLCCFKIDIQSCTRLFDLPRQGVIRYTCVEMCCRSSIFRISLQECVTLQTASSFYRPPFHPEGYIQRVTRLQLPPSSCRLTPPASSVQLPRERNSSVNPYVSFFLNLSFLFFFCFLILYKLSFARISFLSTETYQSYQ